MEQETKTVENQPQEKTLTVEEVNEIVKTRLAKERKKYPSKEELQEYTDWKESQKTNDEKHSEQLKALQSERDQYKNELTFMKQSNEVSSMNVKQEFLKFVTSEVHSLVTEERGFSEALKQYVNDNPQYLKTEETKPKVKTVAQNQRANTTPYDDYKAKKYKNNRYYKK